MSEGVVEDELRVVHELSDAINLVLALVHGYGRVGGRDTVDLAYLNLNFNRYH